MGHFYVRPLVPPRPSLQLGVHSTERLFLSALQISSLTHLCHCNRAACGRQRRRPSLRPEVEKAASRCAFTHAGESCVGGNDAGVTNTQPLDVPDEEGQADITAQALKKPFKAPQGAGVLNI